MANKHTTELNVVTKVLGLNEFNKLKGVLDEFAKQLKNVTASTTSVKELNNVISALADEAYKISQAGNAFNNVVKGFNNLSNAQRNTGQITQQALNNLQNLGYQGGAAIGQVTQASNALNTALGAVAQQLQQAQQHANNFNQSLKIPPTVIGGLQQAAQAVSNMTGGLRGATSMFSAVSGDLARMAAGWLSVRGAMQVVQSGYKIIQRDQEALGKIAVVYENATKGQLEGELQNIKNVANEIGVAYDGAIKGFAQLGVAMKKTGESSKNIQTSFRNMAKIAAGLQLSSEATTRLYAAVTQSYNKTKIQAEELVQQFGEVVPGAAAIAREALKDVFPDLSAALKRGELDATHWNAILQAVVDNLDKAIVASQTSLRAQLFRIGNAWDDLQKHMMTSPAFGAAMSEGLDTVFNFLKSNQAKKLIEELGQVISYVMVVTIRFATSLANVAEILDSVLPGGLSTTINVLITLTGLLGGVGLLATRVIKFLQLPAGLAKNWKDLGDALKPIGAALFGIQTHGSTAVNVVLGLAHAFKLLGRAALIGFFVEVAVQIWDMTDGFAELRGVIAEVWADLNAWASQDIFGGMELSLRNVIDLFEYFAYTTGMIITNIIPVVAKTIRAIVASCITGWFEMRATMTAITWDDVFIQLEYAVKRALVKSIAWVKSSVASWRNAGLDIAMALADPIIGRMQLVVDTWNKIMAFMGHTPVSLDLRSVLRKQYQDDSDAIIAIEEDKNQELLKLEDELQSRLAVIRASQANDEGINAAKRDAEGAAAVSEKAWSEVFSHVGNVADKIYEKHSNLGKAATDVTNKVVKEAERASDFLGNTSLSKGVETGVGKLDDRLKALKKDLQDVVKGFNQLTIANARAGRDSTIADKLDQIKAKYAPLIEQAERLKNTLTDADLSKIYDKLDNKTKQQIDKIRATGVGLGAALYEGIMDGIAKQNVGMLDAELAKTAREVDRIEKQINRALNKESDSEFDKVTEEYRVRAKELERVYNYTQQIADAEVVVLGHVRETTRATLENLEANIRNNEVLLKTQQAYAVIKDSVTKITDEVQRLKNVGQVFQDIADAALLTGNELAGLARNIIPDLQRALGEAIAEFNELSGKINWGDPKDVAQIQKLTNSIKGLQKQLLETRYAAGEFGAAIEKAIPKAFDAATNTMLDFFEQLGKGEKEWKDWKDAALDALRQVGIAILRELINQQVAQMQQTVIGWANSIFGGMSSGIGGLFGGLFGGSRNVQQNNGGAKEVISGVTSFFSDVFGGNSKSSFVGSLTSGTKNGVDESTAGGLVGKLLQGVTVVGGNTTDILGIGRAVEAICYSIASVLIALIQAVQTIAVVVVKAIEAVALSIVGAIQTVGVMIVRGLVMIVPLILRGIAEIIHGPRGWGPIGGGTADRLFGGGTFGGKDGPTGDKADQRLYWENKKKEYEFLSKATFGLLDYENEINHANEKLSMLMTGGIAPTIDSMGGLSNAVVYLGDSVNYAGQGVAYANNYFDDFSNTVTQASSSVVNVTGDMGKATQSMKVFSNTVTDSMGSIGGAVKSVADEINLGFDVKNIGHNIPEWTKQQMDAADFRWGDMALSGAVSMMPGSSMLQMPWMEKTMESFDIMGAHVLPWNKMLDRTTAKMGQALGVFEAHASEFYWTIEQGGVSIKESLTIMSDGTETFTRTVVGMSDDVKASLENAGASVKDFKDAIEKNFMNPAEALYATTPFENMNKLAQEGMGKLANDAANQVTPAITELSNSLNGLGNAAGQLGNSISGVVNDLSAEGKALADAFANTGIAGPTIVAEQALTNARLQNTAATQALTTATLTETTVDQQATVFKNSLTAAQQVENILDQQAIDLGLTNNLIKQEGVTIQTTEQIVTEAINAANSVGAAAAEANANATKDKLNADLGAAGAAGANANATRDKFNADLGGTGAAGANAAATNEKAKADLGSGIAAATAKPQIDSYSAAIAGSGTAAGLGSGLYGLFHSGGVVGSIRNRKRNVSPFTFVGAPRYHSGGFAGLRPDEYPAILERNEEVLATNDPRNILNGRGSGSSNTPPMNVEIVNQIDAKEVLSNALNNATGRRMLVNAIQTEKSKISSILG